MANSSDSHSLSRANIQAQMWRSNSNRLHRLNSSPTPNSKATLRSVQPQRPTQHNPTDSIRSFHYDSDAHILGESELAISTASSVPTIADLANQVRDTSDSESNYSLCSSKAPPPPQPTGLKSMIMSMRSHTLSIGTADYDDFFDMPDGLSTPNGGGSKDRENLHQSILSTLSVASPCPQQEYVFDDGSSSYSLTFTISSQVLGRNESVDARQDSAHSVPCADSTTIATSSQLQICPTWKDNMKYPSLARSKLPSSPHSFDHSETKTDHEEEEEGSPEPIDEPELRSTARQSSPVIINGTTGLSTDYVVCYETGTRAGLAPATGFLRELVKAPIQQGEFRIWCPNETHQTGGLIDIPVNPAAVEHYVDSRLQHRSSPVRCGHNLSPTKASEASLAASRAIRFIKSYTNIKRPAGFGSRPGHAAPRCPTRLFGSIDGKTGREDGRKEMPCLQSQYLDESSDRCSPVHHAQRTKIWPWPSLRRQTGKMGKRRSLARLFGQTPA